MIQYIKGDATYPERTEPEGIKVIVHVVNTIGAWGAGFVLALNKRWLRPKMCYMQNPQMGTLGNIELVQVEKDIWVCNLVGQSGIKGQNKKTILDPFSSKYEIKNDIVQPIRYDAIYSGLRKLQYMTDNNKDVSIHMPKIGAGLAGGDWNKIEKIINDIFKDEKVYVYLWE